MIKSIRNLLLRRTSGLGGALIIITSLALLAAACGGGGDGGSSSGGEASAKPIEPANKAALGSLSGNIVVDGSSTVYPITQAAAEEFARYAKNVRVSVGIAGTGGGFKRFCNNETDISDASRPILASEKDACQKAGVEYIEVPVAFDGIVVVVSPRNNFVGDCITVAELKKIWEPAAQGKVTSWNQVRSSWPNQPLKLFGPGTDSGTFDYFTEAINGTTKSSRGDYQASEDDNVLVQGVSTDQNALGYFGFAYLVENRDKLKAVKVDSGNGTCVDASFDSIANASYQPLSRPLFIYVKKSVASRPEIKEFVNFYLSKSFTPLIPTREVGYVKLADPLYEASTRRFAAGTIGTLWPNGAEVGATLDRYTR